jgi:hypothetical protein
MTITDADSAFNEAWDQLVNTCNGDVKEIGDRLRSQARFGMFNDLSKDPDEEHAWSRAQSDCIAYQQKHGSLTIEATS